MKPIEIKKSLESLILIIFCAAFLWFAASNILANKISHEYPFGYMANDAIQNYGIAEGIKENGNYRYQPMSVAGGYKDVVGTHYPLIYHNSILFHFAAGIPIYDSIIIMVIFGLLITSLVMYLLIRNFNKHAAIVSLPLMLLVTYGKFSSGITWGQHGAISSGLFLVSMIWAFSKFELNDLFFIILFLSASFFGHPSGFVFCVAFIIIYLVIKFLNKELKLSHLKKIAVVGVISFLIISYYFVIVKYAWVSTGFLTPEIITAKKHMEGGAFPAMLLFKDFNYFIVTFFMLGLILSIFLLIKRRNTTIIAFIFLLLVGLSNYFGFRTRAFQQRFLWPIYIAGLFGIGIYFTLKFIFRKKNLLYSSAAFLILLIVFVSIYSGKTTAGSMMDPYHWDSFMWIRENIDKEDIVHFFYQDIFSQRATYYASSQRESHLIDVTEFIKSLNGGIIKRHYKFVVSAEGGALLPYRKSFFSFGYHLNDLIEKTKDPLDICSIKYIVYDKLSRQQQIVNYNILIMDQIIKNDWIEEVYSNPVVSILKNNKPGEDCIVEQRING